MAFLIPETTLRLQATALVQDKELAAIGHTSLIHEYAKHLAETALWKLLRDCIKAERDYEGQTLRLDVYVLSPAELHKMLVDARLQGETDAKRWIRPSLHRGG